MSREGRDIVVVQFLLALLTCSLALSLAGRQVAATLNSNTSKVLPKLRWLVCSYLKLTPCVVYCVA